MHSYGPIDADDVSVPGDVYALLSSRERRATLRRLAAADLPVAVADLARGVARELESTDADESGPNAGPPPEHLQELHVRLYHCDLPKLADHGLVAVDQDRRTVTLQERGERIAGYLNADGKEPGEAGNTA